MRKVISNLCLYLVVLVTMANAGQKIAFPDLPGYQTLFCDFHMHTVFSDGDVWPTVRVNEALREGLDVIAITDHLEHHKHGEDVRTNHNRSYEIAAPKAAEAGILLVRGAEITKSTPPGHYNAVFIRDAAKLLHKHILDAAQAADQQGGFVFWNHHDWKGEERGNWTELQTHMVEKGWLSGMEVANTSSYFPRAHQWCLDRNLTMFGNSDSHRPNLWKEYTPDDHRTITLVFARERTLEAVREAMDRGRTAVWFENQLIGRREYLEPLFLAAAEIERTDEGFQLVNKTCMNLIVQSAKSQKRVVPALSSAPIKIDPESDEAIELTIDNFLIAPNQGLTVELPVGVLEPVAVQN